MCDIVPERCTGYDSSVKIKMSPKEVAEESEIIISGIITHGYILALTSI